MMKAKIQSIRIERQIDENPDTSHLGDYSNQPNGQHSIDHKARGHQGHGEYRFFNPCVENYAGCSAEDIAKYCEQDYQRFESLNRGSWQYVGIIAKAVVVSANGICQTLRSGGLWGIESDSDKSYIEEVSKEQLAELRAELESFGFGKRAIDRAFKSVEPVTN